MRHHSDCGYYTYLTEQAARMEAAHAHRMSPTARLLAFPGKYARPVPIASDITKAQDEINALEKKNAKLLTDIARLQLEIEELKRAQPVVSDIHFAYGHQVNALTDLASAVTGVSVEIIKGPRRDRNLSWPRHFATWFVHQIRWDLSFGMLAKHFCRRDHTTIMHAIRHVETLRDMPPFAGWITDPRIQDALSAAKKNATSTVNQEANA